MGCPYSTAPDHRLRGYAGSGDCPGDGPWPQRYGPPPPDPGRWPPARTPSPWGCPPDRRSGGWPRPPPHPPAPGDGSFGRPAPPGSGPATLPAWRPDSRPPPAPVPDGTESPTERRSWSDRRFWPSECLRRCPPRTGCSPGTPPSAPSACAAAWGPAWWGRRGAPPAPAESFWGNSPPPRGLPSHRPCWTAPRRTRPPPSAAGPPGASRDRAQSYPPYGRRTRP